MPDATARTSSSSGLNEFVPIVGRLPGDLHIEGRASRERTAEALSAEWRHRIGWVE